jgi:MSHA pilin protein MshD
MYAGSDRPRSQPRRRRHAQGATLIEVVLFIVILSIALASILGLLALAIGRSGDPMVLRQSIAVAESLLQEVMAQPFTTNDPDGGANAIGPETGESRASAGAPFDHVDDYHGLTLNGITAPDGTPLAGLQNYNASVTVETAAVGGIAAGDGLLVRVTVTGPDAIPITVAGYRARVTP